MSTSEEWMEEAETSTPPSLGVTKNEKQLSRGLRTLINSVLICGAIGFVMAAVITYVLPKKYESIAVVQVMPTTPELDPFGGQMDRHDMGTGMTPQFFANEFEVIASEQTLQRVVERLDLTARWNQDPDTVIAILKGIIGTQQIQGTDLIEIRVRHTSADDARDIAEKIAEAYRERRTAMEMDRAQRALSAFDRELRDQEDLVEAKHKVLQAIFQQVGIPQQAALSDEDWTDWAAEALRKAQLKTQEHKEKTRLLGVEEQILLKLKNDELLRQAMAREDGAVLRELWRDHQVEANTLASYEQSGLQDSDDQLVRQRAKVSVLAKQVEEVAAGMREEMQTRLHIAEQQLEVMNAEVAELRDEAVLRATEARGYVEARQEYETARALLQSMQLQHSKRRIALRIPKTPIIIHEEPKKGKTPVSPKVAIRLTIGTVKGVVFGLILGLLLWLWRKLASSTIQPEDEEWEEWEYVEVEQ